MLGYREEGGRVLVVWDHTGATVWRAGSGSLSGVVFDSLRLRPLAGAEVILDGTQYISRTDSGGVFRFTESLPGDYAATFRHPVLDTLDFRPPLKSVRSDSGSVSEFAFHIPANTVAIITAAEQAWRDTIRAVGRALGLDWEFRKRREPGDRSRAITGRVVDETGAPVAAARVDVSGGGRPPP